MNDKEYFDFVSRSRCDVYGPLLAVTALAEETGELCGVVKKAMVYRDPAKIEAKYGMTVREKILDEAGDVLYQLCVVLDIYGFDLEKVMDTNHEKLIRRHGGEGTASDGGER